MIALPAPTKSGDSAHYHLTPQRHLNTGVQLSVVSRQSSASSDQLSALSLQSLRRRGQGDLGFQVLDFRFLILDYPHLTLTAR